MTLKGVYVPAIRPYAPFRTLRCALDFARSAHAAGYRVAEKGEKEVRRFPWLELLTAAAAGALLTVGMVWAVPRRACMGVDYERGQHALLVHVGPLYYTHVLPTPLTYASLELLPFGFSSDWTRHRSSSSALRTGTAMGRGGASAWTSIPQPSASWFSVWASTMELAPPR